MEIKEIVIGELKLDSEEYQDLEKARNILEKICVSMKEFENEHCTSNNAILTVNDSEKVATFTIREIYDIVNKIELLSVDGVISDHYL